MGLDAKAEMELAADLVAFSAKLIKILQENRPSLEAFMEKLQDEEKTFYTRREMSDALQIAASFAVSSFEVAESLNKAAEDITMALKEEGDVGTDAKG